MGQEAVMKVARSLVVSMLAVLAPFIVTAESPEATPASDGTTPVMAVWVEQEIYFPYNSVTAYYSCEGLKSKVTSILEAIGARPGFKVTARGCFNRRSGAELMPSLEIVAAMPRAATPEVLSQLAKDASRQELAAKAGGKAPSTPDATAEFPARPRQVEFKDTQLGMLQPGDCDLVEQMIDKVFVPLGAKVVAQDMNCFPRTLNRGIISLTIEVLEPVPEQ